MKPDKVFLGDAVRDAKLLDKFSYFATNGNKQNNKCHYISCVHQKTTPPKIKCTIRNVE